MCMDKYGSSHLFYWLQGFPTGWGNQWCLVGGEGTSGEKPRMALYSAWTDKLHVERYD